MSADQSSNPSMSFEELSQLIEAAQRSYERGDFAEARLQYEQALDAVLLLHGVHHVDTAVVQRGLAVTLFELGEYATAEALLEQARGTREAILGRKHPDTAQVLNGLACVRFGQGDIDGGIKYVQEALAIREASLGPEHPDTIESFNNLGVFLYHQGDHQRAVEIHTEALTRCEHALGDHHSTIETLNALAAKLARESTTYERARELYERGLKMSERVLGATHPLTAVLMNNLAAVMVDLGQHGEARVLLDQSLVLHEHIFGPEHLKTAWVLFNLGDVEWKTEALDSARLHLTRALIIRDSVLGAQDPATIRTLRKLVGVLGTLGEQGDQAALMVSMPLHTCLTAFDFAAGRLQEELAYIPGAGLDVHRAEENLHELVGKLAAELQCEPLTSQEKEKLEQAVELEARARAFVDVGEYVEAEERLRRSLDLREQVLGSSNIDLVPALKLLEIVLLNSGRSSAVLPICRRIADIHITALGEGHPNSLMALSDLARLLDREYGPGAGSEVWERIQQARETYYGPDDMFARLTDQVLENLISMRQHTESEIHADVPHRSRSEKREGYLEHPSALVAEILPGLNAVDWSSLQHAYGSAEDVPILLSMLLSDEADVREDAFEQLFGNIWHQGTVYEASAYAVPFLLRMLADVRTPDRLGVLSLLSSLATGSSFLSVHHREDDDLFDMRKLVAQRGEDFDSALEKELGWVKSANEAVAEGIDLLLGAVEDEGIDAKLRLEALGTIAALPTCTSVSAPRLRALLAASTDRQIRIAVTRTLHELMDDHREAQQFFVDLLHDGDSDAIRLIAAIALLVRARENAPSEAVDEVFAALRQLGKHPHHIGATKEERGARQAVEERFWLSWWGEFPIRFCLDALLALGGDRARTALIQAAHLLSDPEDVLIAAGMLLELVFECDILKSAGTAYSQDKQTGVRKIEFWDIPEPAPREAKALKAAQREVLSSLVEHDPLWEYQSNLLAVFGLPTERNALRTFLASRGE